MMQRPASALVGFVLAVAASSTRCAAQEAKADLESRRAKVLATRAAMAAREAEFLRCPVSYQDGPSHVVNLWADSDCRRFLATGDGALWVGDSGSGSILSRVGPCSDDVFGLGEVLALDDERFAVFDQGAGSVFVVDARAGDRVATLGADDRAVVDVVGDESSRLLLTVDTTGAVEAFDLVDSERLATHFPRFDGEAREWNLADGFLFVVAMDGHATLFEARTGTTIETFESATAIVHGAATRNGDVWFEERDRRVVHCEAPDYERQEIAPPGTELRKLTVVPEADQALLWSARGVTLFRAGGGAPVEQEFAAKSAPEEVTYSFRGDRVLASYGDHAPPLRLFELSTLRPIALQFTGTTSGDLPRFSADGSALVCRSGQRYELQIFATADGSLRRKVESPESPWACALDRDAKRILAVIGGGVGCVDLSSESPEWNFVTLSRRVDPTLLLGAVDGLRGNGRSPMCGVVQSRAAQVAAGASGVSLYPSGFDVSASHWITQSVASGTESQFRTPRQSLTRMPISLGMTRLVVIETASATPTVEVEIPTAATINELQLSPDDRHAWIEDEQSCGWLVDLVERRIVARIEKIGEVDFRGARLDAFSADSLQCVIALQDGSAQLLSTATGALVAHVPKRGELLEALALDPADGRIARLAWKLESHPSAERPLAASASDHELWIDAFKDGATAIGPIPWDGGLSTLALRDGRCVGLDLDGVVREFEEGGTTELARLDLLGSGIRPGSHGAAVFSAGLSELWTVTHDATLRRWDAKTGRCLETGVLYEDGASALVFGPDGYYEATGRADELARVRVGGRELPLSCYRRILARPDLLAAASRGEAVAKPVLPEPPELQITAPISSDVESDHVTLEARVHDRYGIVSITAAQDGREIPAASVKDALVLDTGGNDGRIALSIALPEGGKETRVVLRAENRRHVLSRPQVEVLRRRAPRRELYLLALGVGRYDESRLDLQYPVKDCDDLIARFRAQEGPFYERVHVERLADREVTVAAVQRLREKFLQRARAEDTIVVFVAGHGLRTESSEYWFLTSGASPAEPYSGIDRATLERLVTWDRLHAQRRVLLLDTCFSGSTLESGLRGASPLVTQKDVDALAEKARQGLYILAASSDREFAREKEGNGLFTGALLRGLDGEADAAPNGDGDGFVTIDELQRYSAARVHEWSGGEQETTQAHVEAGEAFRLARVPEAAGRKK